MASDAQEYDTLFQDYLKVCNRALEANKDAFPYKQIWSMTEQAMGGKSIKLALYDDRPKACYCLHLKDHKLKTTVGCDRSNPGNAWRVNYSYLKHVVDNPEDYVNHPARLDWDWLKDRFGA